MPEILVWNQNVSFLELLDAFFNAGNDRTDFQQSNQNGVFQGCYAQQYLATQLRQHVTARPELMAKSNEALIDKRVINDCIDTKKN